MEHIRNSERSEALIPLRYPQGWQEILEAPDAVDYQQWLVELVTITQEQLDEKSFEWASNPAIVLSLWQLAIEQIADAAIDIEDLDDLSEAEIVETALITLQTNIASMGWDEEGLIFTVPNLFTGEEATIDMRGVNSIKGTTAQLLKTIPRTF